MRLLDKIQRHVTTSYDLQTLGANKKQNSVTAQWFCILSSFGAQNFINNTEIQKFTYHRNSGRDNSGGTVTRYGLESPGIEYRCGRDFPHPSEPPPRLKQPPVQCVPGVLCEGKAAEAWRLPPTPI